MVKHIYLVGLALLMTSIAVVSSRSILDLFNPFSYLSKNLRDFDAVYNLGPFYRRRRLGRSKTSPHVTVVEGFTGSRFGLGCRRRGVLKVTLSNSTIDTSRSRVLIDFDVFRPSGYAFNVGDSVSNNGQGGGDSGDQTFDSEVVGNGRNFDIYKNDAAGGGKAVGFENFYRTRMTVVIGDGEIIWISDLDGQVNYLRDEGLFALNDQFDSEGSENFDIYIGINRAIQGESNTGSGVCAVGVHFLPIIDGDGKK